MTNRLTKQQSSDVFLLRCQPSFGIDVLTFASERIALSANGKAQLVLKYCLGVQLA